MGDDESVHLQCWSEMRLHGGFREREPRAVIQDFEGAVVAAPSRSPMWNPEEDLRMLAFFDSLTEVNDKGGIQGGCL